MPLAALPTLTAALLAAAGPAASSPRAEAYARAWSGDAAAARAALMLSPGALPDDGEGLLVLGCLELESGRLDLAEAAAARLAGIEPRAGEGKVLAALVVRRRLAPREPMAEALAEAWKAAGRPDLGARGPLSRLAGTSLPPSPTADALARLSPEEAFLLGGLDSPRRPISREAMRLAQSGGWLQARRDRAEALAGRPAPRPVAHDLAVLGLLGPGQARERVRAALARAFPENGYFSVAAVSGPPLSRGPLVATEVAAIEKAVAHPRLVPPRGALHDALLAAARRLDPRLAAAWARAALGTVTPPPTPLVALSSRALATQDPALRARAGKALERAAATLARDPTVDGRQLGVLLGKAAAELRGDTASGKAALERFEAWRLKVVAAEKALAEDRWPLPSLRQDWRPDQEVARAGRLAGAVPE